MMDLGAMQQALARAGVDGWLFCDFHHRDLMAYRILGVDPRGMTSRRWFYFVPTSGEPVRLCHRVEPNRLKVLPGRLEHYLAWTELHAQLEKIVAGKKVAMQYSPLNQIPYISVVDAGTVDLVRSLGAEVVSSADLVQQFEAVIDDEGFRSHREAGEKIQSIKDEAFEHMGRALREGRSVTENDIKDLILGRFEEQGLTPDGAVPIVGFNEHPADPHFEPTPENAHTLRRGDTVLIDLWARRKTPPGVYYDVTWCGFAGDEPPARYVEIFDVVCRARDAALALVTERIEAGTACHGYEVDQAARDVVTAAGFGKQFLHRTGHNITTEVHGNGANIDNLETRDERLLVPGTCFSVEPGIYLDGEMAVRSEINVCITPQSRVEVYGPIQQELVRIG